MGDVRADVEGAHGVLVQVGVCGGDVRGRGGGGEGCGWGVGGEVRLGGGRGVGGGVVEALRRG